MLCDAIPYWRGKGGRREGVKELSLLLSLLISLLSSFRGFPVVLFHCALNLPTCSSTHYWYATGPNKSAPTPAGHRCAAQSCSQHRPTDRVTHKSQIIRCDSHR
ncbi:hypothetical protein B9Z19DRAFT_470393 [Tuber borchii]|uniref:Uncharacterized protein n=1 Tax=Tuber borchii TaxID=42251 RepID=A0A2T6ZFP3_TUBBO|nr:hypothetical protein B9Z19DRAFT_470393 [Tuber borchii]